MSIEEFIPALAEYVSKKIADEILVTSESISALTLSERIKASLTAHVNRIANWSSHVQFFRMPSARDVDTETIPLTFNSTPRRFRTSSIQGKSVTEDDLLGTAKHLLILGPPGAGKTTTLKRIARTMLAASPSANLDAYQTPMLVRLREFNTFKEAEHPLLRAVAGELGLSVNVPEERESVIRKLPDGTTEVKEIVKRLDPLCEGRRLVEIIPKILNQLNLILLLDGLDEVNPSMREAVEHDIERLLENCQTYRIIGTCRSGEYTRPIGYMTTIEVCELQEDDIADLAQRWIGEKHGAFLAKIRKPSLRELSSRPLFLTHMLTLFDLDGTLPEQPFELYELMLMLLIREWDRERRVQRKSRYADFGPEKKLRFMASIAYQLTYEVCIKVFTHQDLVHIYSKVHRAFDLPADEASLVASELESHTGIVCETGSHHYEFSHLTLQEYLCAAHLVRAPFPQRGITRLLAEYPAPLAIATALSADPAGWLAAVLLNKYLIDSNEQTEKSLNLFMDRLEAENPIFTNSEAVGCCILALSFQMSRVTSVVSRRNIEAYLARLVSRAAARRSFIVVITQIYNLTPDANHTGLFWAQRGHVPLDVQALPIEMPEGLDLPEKGLISRAWLEQHFYNDLLLDGCRVTSRR